MSESKFTLEEVRQAFIKHGATPLFTEYKNSKTPLLFKCKCGNDHKIRYGQIKNRNQIPRCFDCHLTKLPTLKEVQQAFRDKGAIPLFTEYKNAATPLPFKCKCGNEHKIRYLCIKNGNQIPRCPACHRNKQPTLEEVRQFFINKGVTPLFTEYKNANTKLPFKCKCGNEHSMKYKNLVHKNYIPRCLECNKKKALTLQEVKQVFINRDAIPLFDEYKNNQTPLPFKCKCGNEYKTTYNNLTRYGAKNPLRCPDCLPNKPPEFKVVKQAFIDCGVTPLFTEYKNAYTKLPFVCKCGTKHSILYRSILNLGIIPKCPECQYKDRPRGKDHFFYKHDMSDYERKYGRIRSTVWRAKVLRRDKYTCVISGIKGKALVCAHHIYNFSDYKELREVPENGITLSKVIHKEFHKVHGRANNTLDQFSEFYQTKTNEGFRNPFRGKYNALRTNS